ncbi:MAG TPA: isopentenyl-diphosphate Delta-isomerase [Phnomibacter sp.]|nr:isopentenyl-diphosphate Delta-isomerase [Phnomibacter sp.]
MTQVILVNEQDEPQGTMEKLEAHRKPILHRAFSVFLFNSNGQMLLQQRALHKYHSGGLWTNTCCSHPYPGEDITLAARRRLQEEMGIDTALTKAFEFVYQAAFDNGLYEYEYDHVFVGQYNGPVNANPDEVAMYCYKPLQQVKQEMRSNPEKYTAWFKIALPRLEQYMQTVEAA